MKNGASLCWSMSHTDYAKDTDEEPNSALQMFFKRTRIGRIARIALWALQLEVFKTTNTIGTTDTTVGDVVAGGLKEH